MGHPPSTPVLHNNDEMGKVDAEAVVQPANARDITMALSPEYIGGVNIKLKLFNVYQVLSRYPTSCINLGMRVLMPDPGAL